MLHIVAEFRTADGLLELKLISSPEEQPLRAELRKAQSVPRSSDYDPPTCIDPKPLIVLEGKNTDALIAVSQEYIAGNFGEVKSTRRIKN